MLDRTEVFLEKYRTPLPAYLSEMSKHAQDHNIPIITRGTGDVLRYILRTVVPDEILEIGTAIGFSALFMKECLPDEDVHITTIEKIESRYSQAELNFSKYDKDNSITLIKEDAGDAINRLREEGKRYKVVFLDAAKGQYIYFLPVLIDLMDVGGVLVTDNIFHNGVVMNSKYAVNQRDRTIHERLREFLAAVTGNERLESLIFPVDDGIVVSKKIKQ